MKLDVNRSSMTLGMPWGTVKGRICINSRFLLRHCCWYITNVERRGQNVIQQGKKDGISHVLWVRPFYMGTLKQGQKYQVMEMVSTQLEFELLIACTHNNSWPYSGAYRVPHTPTTKGVNIKLDVITKVNHIYRRRTGSAVTVWQSTIIICMWRKHNREVRVVSPPDVLLIHVIDAL